MSLSYFYEPDINTVSNTIVLSEETSKHCIQVLRMRAGEQLQLTDGKGSLFTAAISKEDKRRCEVRIEQKEHIAQSSQQISIGISLLKNASRMEWFLEKATEMGINEIIPLLCDRTERQHFRHDRMENILISAMLQSQQAWLPVLHQPVHYNTLVTTSIYPQKLIAHCEQAEKATLKSLSPFSTVQLLIGPEGDFSLPEIDLATSQGYLPVTLGNTRLRTETAGVVAAALLVNN